MFNIDNFTKRFTDTAKVVTKKSSELVEVTKLTLSIGTEEEKIEKAYAEMGKLMYEAFAKGEEIGEIFKESCEKIKSYEEAIVDIKKKINELKSIKVCPGCSAELNVDIAFCPMCGTKQEIPQPPVVVEVPTKKVCPSCSADNELDSLYCTKCGTKLDPEQCGCQCCCEEKSEEQE